MCISFDPEIPPLGIICKEIISLMYKYPAFGLPLRVRFIIAKNLKPSESPLSEGWLNTFDTSWFFSGIFT